jgi:hypothetical protein
MAFISVLKDGNENCCISYPVKKIIFINSNSRCKLPPSVEGGETPCYSTMFRSRAILL